MQYGYRHRLQCLPRMLTLYCDYGNDLIARGSATKKPFTGKERSAVTEVVNVMKGFAKSIPPVAWLITLPQLISRILHPHPDVGDVLQALLLGCMEHFPHQALWAQAGLMGSLNKKRQQMAKTLQGTVRLGAGRARAQLTGRGALNLAVAALGSHAWRAPTLSCIRACCCFSSCS
jgi:serine/threonine-protein kinase ATR